MTVDEFMLRIMKTHDTALTTMRQLYVAMGELHRRFDQKSVEDDARIEELRLSVSQLQTERLERMRVRL